MVGTYRPVSLLPLPSEIVHNRLSEFIEVSSMLDKKQEGLRKEHSTINTIANLTSDIFDGINNGQLSTACFIDMEKAFDMVNHDILCKQLCKIRNNRKFYKMDNKLFIYEKTMCICKWY